MCVFNLTEVQDGVFISHCGVRMLEAESACMERQSTLASSRDLLSDLSQVRPAEIEVKDIWFWTSEFFTPWIWSNGKVVVVA